ncbi:unnamed protein product [Rotaria magnacalcarata]|uniref:Uncharacterized protein n=2 Tax=Rotaria magnacalcarata TaxID=392030 RepID=A0A820LMA2_9BILA|nr:unnamed protein product [Rotaria magnacalcarata]
MSLRDDKFIDFVQAEAGGGAAALLEIQGINCVKSLLMTSNVYSIMDLKSKSLDGFKNKYGYMQDDGTFVIHPGIKGNIEYLIDLLKKKCIEDAKVAKSSKYNQSSSSTIANWCENNKSKFNLLKLSSIEGQHYFISIFNDPSGALKCDIKCCCKKWSSLTLRRGKFQLSNFYRHLQGSGNVCLELKKMINNSQLPLPSTTNTQQSLTTSDYVPQQVALANFISIIPSSDINQSNSTSSTASSISTSTDNNERIIQQSSSLPTRR